MCGREALSKMKLRRKALLKILNLGSKTVGIVKGPKKQRQFSKATTIHEFVLFGSVRGSSMCLPHNVATWIWREDAKAMRGSCCQQRGTYPPDAVLEHLSCGSRECHSYDFIRQQSLCLWQPSHTRARAITPSAEGLHASHTSCSATHITKYNSSKLVTEATTIQTPLDAAKKNAMLFTSS